MPSVFFCEIPKEKSEREGEWEKTYQQYNVFAILKKNHLNFNL